MTTQTNLRALAATLIHQVLEQGKSLTALLPEQQSKLKPQDRALLQELCFGSLRVLPQLDWCLQQLMAKPLKSQQRALHSLLRVGLYQLIHTRIPAHAAVAETVKGAVTLQRPQLKGLINGVLRQFQRRQAELLQAFQQTPQRFLHPEWLLTQIQQAWPEQWQEIIDANNQKPPMWIRVNSRHHSREAYQALLAESNISSFLPEEADFFPDALRLDPPCPVAQLPGFAQGWATVQDLAAQGCVTLLQPRDGERILDLCAAPGGKTTHILQVAPAANVMAVDIDEERLKQVADNLQRLQQQAQVCVGDGRTPQLWAGEQPFDRILLDAPCSASGVIRRHPDIKWLRRPEDIPALAQLQAQILDAVWPLLRSGGVLLYATCSILPEENRQQIEQFLQRHSDVTLDITGSHELPGWQRLPHPEGGDGFFYARLIKN
ncbi:MAG: 16S rRNA (cytosine(967)-C(5))-methyltransferase RsmB [Enterobacteriaceae bacterium]